MAEVKKFLDQAGVDAFWAKVKAQISEEVQVVSAIAEAAQSTADSAQSRAEDAYIAADDAGLAVTVIRKNLEDNYLTKTELVEQAETLTASVNAYTDTKVSEVSAKITALGSVMNYKGTKATKADLPTTGDTTGDVWHVTADSGEYAWDGTEWQELGSTIDMSGYEENSNKVTSMSSTSTDTQYPSAKAVYTALSGKANSSHTHTASEITDFAASIPITSVKFNGTALDITDQAVNVQAATTAQGALADTALQPDDIVAIPTTYINALS